MAEEESGLLDRNGSLFPLVERNTPVMDRIRRFRNGEQTLVSDFAQASARHILAKEGTKEAEKLKEEGAEAMEAYREALAEELGVPEEAIKEEVVEAFGRMYSGLDEEEVVDEKVLNILNGDMPEGEEENEPLFGDGENEQE